MEVCTTLTLGKQPRLSAWDMMEKAPEIIAWLAMMAAATATTKVGQYKGPTCYF